MKNSNTLNYIFLFIISFLLFVPFIGNMHLFDWDEINFAECAREMVLTGDYSKVQLNFKPFWEKPPLFIWFQAACMNVFGVNEFAARLPNAICGIITLMFLYKYGKNFFSKSVGLLWCFLFAGSLLPHLYFKSGLIDPWFNLFMFLSLIHFIITFNNYSSPTVLKHAVLTGTFLGLAVLTKGPVALVIVVIVILITIISKKQIQFLISKSLILIVVSTITVSLSWFILMFLTGHGNLVKEFIVYQVRLFQTADAGHDGPIYYHVIILLVGCFPASLFFLNGLKSPNSHTPFQLLFKKVMVILFFVVLVLFSVVKTKIVHYSSMCYFPITFVGALYLSDYTGTKILFNKWCKFLFVFISVILIIAIVLVCCINWLKPFILSTNLIKDEFAMGNIKADVYWNGWEWLVVVPLIVATLILLNLKQFGNQQQPLYIGIGLYTLFIALTLNIIVPKVEMYTQNAAIVFYEQVSKYKYDVDSHRFKSYACIFYGGRTPETFNDPEQINFIEKQLDKAEREGHSRFASYSTAYYEWLKSGNIKRPSFLVSKIQDAKEVESFSHFKKLYEKNGFVFFVRMPGQNK